MENLYFVLVSTPGLFASIIRQVTGIEYCHVALAFDPDLHETYSVGRRVPSVPVIAGFVQEDAHRILQVFPTASYRFSFSLLCPGASVYSDGAALLPKEPFYLQFVFGPCTEQKRHAFIQQAFFPGNPP